MAVVLVGDSEGECRQPAAAGHLPIRSFFFPSPSSLASRWRHPEREDHGGPEEDARRRRPHHRRTSTRGGELVGASLHALSAGLVAGNDMQVPAGAPSLPLTAPPPRTCRPRPSPSQCGVAAFYGCSALVGRGRGRGGEAMGSSGEVV
jgi:hypothetical protein